MPFILLLSSPHSALGNTPTWLCDLLKVTRGKASPQSPVGLPWDTPMQAGSTCPACCLRPPGLTTATRQAAPEAGEMRRCQQAQPSGGQGGSDQRLHLCSTPLPLTLRWGAHGSPPPTAQQHGSASITSPALTCSISGERSGLNLTLSWETHQELKFILKCKWLPRAPMLHTGLGSRVAPGARIWWEGVSGNGGVRWGQRGMWPGQGEHWSLLGEPSTRSIVRRENLQLGSQES